MTRRHPAESAPPPAAAVAALRDTRAALRASEDRYRQLVELSPDGILVGCDGVVVYANAALAALLRVPEPASLLGRPILDLVHPDFRPLATARLRTLRETGRPLPLAAARLCRADGTDVAVESSAAPVTHGGRPAALVIFRDITARADAEAALRESEARFRQLAETIREVFWMCDARTGEILYVSPAVEALWGRSAAELSASPNAWAATIHPADRDRVVAANAAIGTTGRYDAVYRLQRPDGTERWVHDRGFPVRDAAGVMYRVAGIAEDITELRASEDALRESERRLRLITDTAPDPVIAADASGRITHANPAAERAFGWPAAALVGQPLTVLIPERLHAAHATALARVRAGAGQRDRTLELAGQRRDGTEFPAEVALGAAGAGPDRHITAVVRDVSARKALEAQLRQAQKMEAVGRLAGGIAHDFNNLLTAILGYVALARPRVGADATLAADLDEVRRAGERAADLTRQLLAFSRKQVLQPRVVDLGAHLHDMERLLARVLGEDIRLVRDVPETLGRVRVDPGQLHQVVVNLAVNARDAMPQGGTLTLAAADVSVDAARAAPLALPAGRYVELRVTDTGVGMDAATQARLFEPFFTTKGPDRGTGLGLSTVYGIAAQSGGGVEVTSAPGAGTTFRVLLPRADHSVAPDAPPAPPPASGSETILVVEDEPAIRRVVIRALAAQGYTVLEAANAAAALAVADTHVGALDLLLTDVVMPGDSGALLAARLRAQRPAMRVLFMTGYPREALAPHGVVPEDVALMPKPFTPEALQLRVRAVLDAPWPEAIGGEVGNRLLTRTIWPPVSA